MFAFSIVMMFGTPNSIAQSLTINSDRPEVIAKTKTANLSEKLKLSGDQKRTVFRALVAKEVNYKKHIDGKDISDIKVSNDKNKFDDALTASMKKTLTAAQFKQLYWLIELRFFVSIGASVTRCQTKNMSASALLCTT